MQAKISRAARAGTIPALCGLLATMLPCAITASPAAAQEPGAAEISGGFISTVQQAAAALGAGDNVRARDLLRAAHVAVPGDARVLLYLAGAELVTGDTARTLDALELLAEQGVLRDLHADPMLARLQGNPRFVRALEQMAANAAPLIRSDTAFQLADMDFLPEGIAYDPVDDVFFVGSLHRGTILRIDRTGEVSELANVATDRRALVIGLRVDASRRRLWAATLVIDSTAPRFRRGVGGRAALHGYDLDSRRRVANHAVSESGPHLLNDIAITPRGDVYVTDSEGDALYRLRADGPLLERFHAGTTDFTYPNGIAVSADGTRLYVAHVEGISSWNLAGADGLVERVTTAPGVAAGGIDGLYACSGSLLAVQSLLGFQRVVLLALDSTGLHIARQQALERQHPAHDVATTGAIAQGAFYYIANSQLGRLDSDQRVAPSDSPRASVVLRLPVPVECSVTDSASTSTSTSEPAITRPGSSVGL
jgi:sugar lactone lactonase YvrE